ncbi:MAG: BtrH N-terminal domain-containing protein [Candidatus Bathyarchaeia archaeon]
MKIRKAIEGFAIEGFVHRPGVHCDTSAIRDVFEYYGFRFSEPMVFGLGSGLGFVYWETRQMPFPFVGGRARDFIRDLCSNLGVIVNVHETRSRRRAYEALRGLIETDNPVMINVDMPQLSYLGLPPEAHFGGHAVVVAGLDEEEGVVHIADTGFKKPQTATLKELEEARASGFKPFPPKNRWFTFRFPQRLTPIASAIRRAIGRTVDHMLNPPIRNLGVKGIRRFADEVVGWPRRYPPERIGWGYDMTYIYLEEDGTGGGCFRYLYSSFLKEAGERVGTEALSQLGTQYRGVGEKWTEIAKLIKNIPSRADNAYRARDLLLEVAEEEEEILNSLKGVVEG